jgi:hypothetical protein
VFSRQVVPKKRAVSDGFWGCGKLFSACFGAVWHGLTLYFGIVSEMYPHIPPHFFFLPGWAGKERNEGRRMAKRHGHHIAPQGGLEVRFLIRFGCKVRPFHPKSDGFLQGIQQAVQDGEQDKHDGVSLKVNETGLTQVPHVKAMTTHEWTAILGQVGSDILSDPPATASTA